MDESTVWTRKGERVPVLRRYHRYNYPSEKEGEKSEGTHFLDPDAE